MTTPNQKPRRRVVNDWTTVAVTALPPGWHNAYRLDDGSVITEVCPAILLQELRSRTHCIDTPTNGGKFEFDTQTREERLDPPYETRAVYAGDDGSGELSPVTDVSNYAGVVAPGEDPNVYAQTERST